MEFVNIPDNNNANYRYHPLPTPRNSDFFYFTNLVILINSLLFFLCNYIIYNIMEFVDIPDNNNANYRYFSYRGSILRSKRDDLSGGFGVYTQYLVDTKIDKLKCLYGSNGDLYNTNACFLLNLPTSSYYNILPSTYGYFIQAIKSFDSTAILSTFKPDNQNQVTSGLDIYCVVSWDVADTSAYTKSNALLSNLNSILTNLASKLSSPLNNLSINNSLLKLSILSNSLPIINYITTTYDSTNNNTA